MKLIPLEPASELKAIALGAVREAVSDVGRGEVFRNNESEYIWSLTGRRTSGPWCAAAVFAWIERASAALSYRCPIERTHNAAKLAERIAEVGRWHPPTVTPHRGWFPLWSRRGGNHIAVVQHVHDVFAVQPMWITIDGNRGKYPAMVDAFPHRSGESRLQGFASLY